jgi:hypothetical protein
MTIEINSDKFAEYQNKKKEYTQAAHDWETKFNNEFSLISMGLNLKWNADWQKARTKNTEIGIIHLDNNLSNNNINNLEYVTESQYYILRELLSSPRWVAECKGANDGWLEEQADFMSRQDAYYLPYPVEESGGLKAYYISLFKRIQQVLLGNLPDDSNLKKYWKKLNERTGSEFAELVSVRKRKLLGLNMVHDLVWALKSKSKVTELLNKGWEYPEFYID